MKIETVIQGTPEWLALRADYFTASEAQAMMGKSKYLTRDQLLQQHATGIVPEVNEHQQALFDRGHQTEESTREIIEAERGEEFYPITGTLTVDSLPLLASMDGVNLVDTLIYEHKLWNESLAASVADGVIPETHYWQLEHQMLVSGISQVLFVVSDGKDQRVSCEYTTVGDRQQQLIAGWHQFDKDLEIFNPEPVAVEVVGTELMSLPSLAISLTGAVNSSNLAEYKDSAMAMIESINTDLKSDQDFADAEQVVKLCAESEKALNAAKDSALSQTADIDELFKTIDHLRESMRSKRLALEKLVKNQKEAIKTQIVLDGKSAIALHVAGLNKELEVVTITPPPIDFAGAIKGKRNLESIKSAVNQVVADAKIEADRLATLVRANLKILTDAGKEHWGLFPDLQQTCSKPSDDFSLLVTSRISSHKGEIERQAKIEADKLIDKERPPADPAPGNTTTAPVIAPSPASTTPIAASKPAVSRTLELITEGYKDLQYFIDQYGGVKEFSSICEEMRFTIKRGKAA